jgi:hypothetical protein
MQHGRPQVEVRRERQLATREGEAGPLGETGGP